VVVLQDKVAFVTGAGSGIGRAVALTFLDHGARVLATGRVPAELEETAALACDASDRIRIVPADLTRAAEVEQGVQMALEAYDRLDIMFNGAGVSGRRHGDGPVDECSEEGWDYVLANNLTSIFLCCKYGVRAMLRSGTGGSIINLSSVLGLTGKRLFATHAYAASKAGIIGLTRAMAVYYADQGIRCNVIAPGLIETPMSRRAQADPAVAAALPELQPLGGRMGQPEDVAAAALYLASDASRLVTGIILPVDAGWTAQ
jgi:NAD(P)-dependent dehydrogenase (short-subunit alcohol dehydrogenase family)